MKRSRALIRRTLFTVFMLAVYFLLRLTPSRSPQETVNVRVPLEPDSIRSEKFVVTGSEIIVRRVVDGDTLVLSDGTRVRLIGVDTPETKHPSRPVEYFGKEASEFTRREIEGRPVRLEYDWQKTDRYGRTLAYVFRASDGFFLNAELIKQGYAHAYTRFPFKRLEDFRNYEREARKKEAGLWRQAA